jgi:hypothetical protein
MDLAQYDRDPTLSALELQALERVVLHTYVG